MNRVDMMVLVDDQVFATEWLLVKRLDLKLEARIDDLVEATNDLLVQMLETLIVTVEEELWK